MTSGAPWSVKGIDPKAREIAKDLARRSGLTLGEWLNQVILEDSSPSEDPTPTDYSSDRYGSDRRPPLYAGAEIYRRVEAPGHMGDEVLRVGEALDRLSARIEAAELRSAQAINGIDKSVNGLVSRLSLAEREQTAVAARFEGAVDDVRTDQARVAERMRRIEQEASGTRAVEGLKSIEGALAKVASHLYENEENTRKVLTGLKADVDGVTSQVQAGFVGTSPSELVDAVVAKLAERLEQAEDRTSTALRHLEASFGILDQRLAATEERLDDQAAEGRQVQLGLQKVAADLTEQVEATRTELAEKIIDAADGRFERMDRTLREMTSHVQDAERRSAHAIERMGHEVLRIADVMGRKVAEVETKSTHAIEQVGGEVKRLASEMEVRLTRSDTAGAQALEKLSGEIARITERLAERIGDAERRSALAIDDVGEQVARATDRMQDRHERSTTELGERIRLSEERTARLLADARTRIDERLAETQRRMEAKPPEATYASPAFAPTAYAAPGFAGPTLGEPIYLDPQVAPFGHDSFAASRTGSAGPSLPHAVAEQRYGASLHAPIYQDIAPETVDYSAEAFPVEDLDARALETLTAEPDALIASGVISEAQTPVDPAADPFSEILENLAAHDPVVSQGEVATESATPSFQAAIAEAPAASPAEAAPVRRMDTLSPNFSAPSAAAPAEPLPGATFVSQPFAIHPQPADTYYSATQTFVSTPHQHEAISDEIDDDLDAPEPESAAPQPAPFMATAAAPEPEAIIAPAAVVQEVNAADEALFAPRPLTTRELIEQARAASRAATSPEPRGRLNPPSGPAVNPLFSGQAAAPRHAGRRRQGSAWANALLITGATAAFSVSVAGYVMLSSKPTGALPQRVAEALGVKTGAAPKAVAPAVTGPILAEALDPKPIADPAATAASDTDAPLAAPAAPNADAVGLYGDATRKIEAHDFSGVDGLKKAANLGYAPAQFYLAKLYEGGEAGLHKDSVEARRWTERAAEGGDKKAMHNLALYYFEGTGGPKNTTTAAQWFRRAADLGLTDSQYNLGRLFEEGFGVPQNPAEAYKWYVIAARSGDAESRISAQRVKGQLSAEAQAAAERAAMTFLAQGPSQQTAQAGSTTSPLATAQRALSHLGYYQGPTDGADSPALKLAIAAYQRDQGLPASGVLDANLNQRLAIIAQ